MKSGWRDWHVVGSAASVLVFAVVFAWLSLFVGAGYDGDSPTPIVPRVMIAAGLAIPVFAAFFLANLGGRRRDSRGFEVVGPVESQGRRDV